MSLAGQAAREFWALWVGRSFQPSTATLTSGGAVEAFNTLEKKAHCSRLHLRQRET